MEQMQKYQDHYSETSFQNKLSKLYKQAEVKVVYAATLAYYAFQSDETPLKAKIQIVGSLGYFIFPFDFIPDVLPAIGYGDDVAALFLALAAVIEVISPTVKALARAKTQAICPQVTEHDFAQVEAEINETA